MVVLLLYGHCTYQIKGNGTSSGGGDESDSNSPTLGKTSSGAQLVTNGFEYNGLTVNVGRYHTEFPLIGTNVGDINTISMKVYDSAGPTGIKRVEFALGVPDIGLYHEAEAFVDQYGCQSLLYRVLESCCHSHRRRQSLYRFHLIGAMSIQ